MNGQDDQMAVMKYCLICGAKIRADKSFCKNCGASNMEQLRAASSGPEQQAFGAEREMSGRQALYPRRQQRGVERVYPAFEYPPQQPGAASGDEPPVKRGGKRKTAIVLIVIFAIVLGAAAFVYFYIRSAINNAPDMRENPRGEGVSGIVRDTGKYTFLVLGADEGEYNTDVIMVVTFDAAGHTLDVVNIPRDTLVNVSWNTKKANSLLANMRAKHRGEDDSEAKAFQSVIERFADVLGFEVDYWVFVNLQAFVSLIDAIDGVDFYVPVNMNYEDRAGGLSIHYSEGTHHLSGQQAVEVMRYRAGYSSGDIGRIGTQQSFLKSAAQQILEKKDSVKVIDLARIFLSYVKTDLKLDDLIWFGYEFMKLDSGDISFHMMPGNISDSVGGNSYVTIYVDEWLELVNSTFNPFDFEIKAGDVSILTRGPDRRLFVTDGNRQGNASWGS